MFGQDDVCALGIQTIPTPKSSYSWFSLSRHKILKSKSVDERSQEFVML